MDEYKEFYILSNPPLLPRGVSEVIQRTKRKFQSQLLEILYDPEVPWFKCITKAPDQDKVLRFIESLQLEITESEVLPIENNIPGGARNDKGVLVDLEVVADEPRVVPWATYADFAVNQFRDYNEFRYPDALQECSHKAVWRQFEKFADLTAREAMPAFLDTVALVCGSFLVPGQVEHLGPYIGCDRVLRNLAETVLFLGGNTLESVEGALQRLDNIFTLMQLRKQASDSRHIIALGVDGVGSGLSYRWLTHLGLAKRTYLSDESHGLLLPPGKGGRTGASDGASLRRANKKSNQMWEADLTSYAQARLLEAGQASSFGPFDRVQYAEKVSNLPMKATSPIQRVAGRSQVEGKGIKAKVAPSYANAAAGGARSRTQTRPRTPDLGTPSSAPSDISVGAQATSTTLSASSSSRPPTLVERLMSHGPRVSKSRKREQDAATRDGLQEWVDGIRASNEQDLGDLISFDEPGQAQLTPAVPVLSPIETTAPENLGDSVNLRGNGSDGRLHAESDHSEDLIDFGLSDESDDQDVSGVQAKTHDNDNDSIQFGRAENPTKKLHRTMGQKAGQRSQAKSQEGPDRHMQKQQPQKQQPQKQQLQRQQQQQQRQNRRLVPGATPKPHDATTASQSAPSALLKSKLLLEMKARVQGLVQNLQIISGEVGLEVKLGRLYIKNLSSSTISSAKSISSDLVWSPEEATEELNQISSKDISFQPILSTTGSDANLLVQLREPGEPRWNPPTTSVVYRFICYHVTTRIEFMVDIDTVSMIPVYRGLEEEIDNVHIHCPEYAWDMKVCATRARMKFPEGFSDFAAALVKSLAVSTDNDGVTAISVANIGRRFEIKEACVVHLAQYQSKAQDGRLLVVKMTKPVSETTETNQARSFRGIVGIPKDKKNCVGFVPEWFEASLRSMKVDEAFELNKTLQTGEKAGWTSEELNEAGAFDGICRLGLSLIPKMDIIGMANDNGHGQSMGTDAQTDAGNSEFAVYQPGFW